MNVYEAAKAVFIDRRETGSSRAGIAKSTREEKAPLMGPFAFWDLASAALALKCARFEVFSSTALYRESLLPF